MPTDPLKLHALAAVAIGEIKPGPGWQRDMERIITRAHTAAYLAAMSERTGVSLAAFKGLSRAERADIKKAVDGQLTYLKQFAQDKAGMSEQAIKARAAMYAGMTRQTYYASRWGDWEISPDLMPGNQQCKSNCKCSISVKDNEDGTGTLTRVMGGTEHHCTECPPLAGDHPVKRSKV